MSDVKIKTSVDQNNHYREKKEAVPMVDIEDEESLKKWAFVLDLSCEDLIVAAKSFGPKISDIRRGLSKQQAA